MDKKTSFEKNYWLLVASILVFALALGMIWYLYFRPLRSSPELDAFAACLTENKVVMYGAVWCPHCGEQKRDFGTAFRLIEYVECGDPNVFKEICQPKGIEGFPTWVYPDGTKLSGRQPLMAIGEPVGCIYSE